MTNWIYKGKRAIKNILGVLFNQSGVSFNESGVYFGGSNKQTEWNYKSKS